MREVDIKRGGRLRAAAPEEADLKTDDREKSDDTGSEATTGFSGGLGIR